MDLGAQIRIDKAPSIGNPPARPSLELGCAWVTSFAGCAALVLSRRIETIRCMIPLLYHGIMTFFLFSVNDIREELKRQNKTCEVSSQKSPYGPVLSSFAVIFEARSCEGRLATQEHGTE